MDTFLSDMMSTIRRYDLLQSGDTVFAALSGGADSVALLHSLLLIKDTLALSQVCAVHVHHGIRGESADRDEQFVTELCDRLDVPLTVCKVDVPLTVRETGESMEEAARRLRYSCLEEVALSVPQAKIATAHSLDDHAETVLLRLVRGTGLKGVAGIPIKRDNIIRPLLECSASQIRAFCKENGYDFVVDETNADCVYARNRIRAMVLPQLREINPCVERAIVRFAKIAKDEDAYLDSLSQQLLDSAAIGSDRFDVSVLLQADAVLRRRVLHRLCKAEYEHIACVDAILKSGGTVNLLGDRSAVSDGVTLRFIQHSRTKTSDECFTADVIIGETIRCGCVCYKPQILSQSEFQEKSKIHKNLFDFCISYDMIEDDLVLRSRQPGDRIRPYGRGCTKDVKKLMNDWHIPCEKRSSVFVLVSECKILSLVGYCVDETVAVNTDTQRILWLEPLGDATKSSDS